MWKSVKLGTLCELVNGKAFKPSDWSEEGIRIVRIQNLNDHTKEYNHWSGPLDKQVVIDSGDLLLAWSGTPGTSFGAHIWNNGKAILNQHIFRIDLHDGIIDPEWAKISINYKLNSLIDQAHGGVGLQHVTKPMVEDLDIPLPPLPIQKKIAAILEKADAAREKRRQANQLTEQFLQSAFLEMFGDPVTNPKGWVVKPFGECIDNIRYATGSPPPYVDKGIPFIRATNVKGGTIVKNELRYISPDDAATIPKCELKTGDLILVRSGVNAGDCAIIPSEFGGAYAAYDLIIELPMSSAVFYNHLINSTFGKTILEPLKRRAGQPHLNADQIKGLELPAPPALQQQKFAGLVEKVEGLRGKQRESEKNLENLFHSLMQRAFRGELVS